jgi:hypothetical protein
MYGTTNNIIYHIQYGIIAYTLKGILKSILLPIKCGSPSSILDIK